MTHTAPLHHPQPPGRLSSLSLVWQLGLLLLALWVWGLSAGGHPPVGSTLLPGNITLQATASDSDGSVTQVEFFNGSTSLGTDTTAPYSLTWANAPLGNHSVKAVATDNAGAQTHSAVAQITVSNAQITYIHTDTSGSPLAATNAAGNVLWKESYRAYGQRQLGMPTAQGHQQWFHDKEVELDSAGWNKSRSGLVCQYLMNFKTSIHGESC